MIERFWPKVKKTESCWLWTGAVKSCEEHRAYGVFWDGGRLVAAHRFAFELMCRPLLSGEIVMHLCNIPRCVNPQHLQAGNQSKNILQAFESGRREAGRCYGSRHPGAKLSEKDAALIKKMASRGLKHRDIARRFSVAYSLVGRIARGESWRHICQS